MMGSPPFEKGRWPNDGAQQLTAITRPFAVGKFEVTFAEWDACVDAGGCTTPGEEGGGTYRPSDEGWGRNNRPVINVSWQDAKRYLLWLNSRIGGRAYRLLTEAEWEYAARSGTTTAYPWGESASRENANFGRPAGTNCCGGYAQGRDQWADQTAPAGSFPANGFKLHDMHGNVSEWLEDCYGDGVTSNNSARGCSDRSLRGGSWSGIPDWLRSASRSGVSVSFRRNDIGFRVARTL